MIWKIFAVIVLFAFAAGTVSLAASGTFSPWDIGATIFDGVTAIALCIFAFRAKPIGQQFWWWFKFPLAAWIAVSISRGAYVTINISEKVSLFYIIVGLAFGLIWQSFGLWAVHRLSNGSTRNSLNIKRGASK